MISPHTKPGTKVVCVANAGDVDDIRPEFRHLLTPGHTFRLKIGSVYTITEIIEAPEFVVPFVAITREYEGFGFILRFFRPLDLPESLTSILTFAPVPQAPAPQRTKEDAPA